MEIYESGQRWKYADPDNDANFFICEIIKVTNGGYVDIKIVQNNNAGHKVGNIFHGQELSDYSYLVGQDAP